VAAVVLAGATTALPGGQGVTLAMREFTNANRVRVLVFSGTIPNPEPNQDVEIVAEDCGVRGNRLFAATKTTNGGVFQVSNENVSTPYGSGVLKPSLDYGGAFNHEAVFTVPARGLRLRGHLPQQGAAPCWLPNSTEPWRS
jgi:hypothetical protein